MPTSERADTFHHVAARPGDELFHRFTIGVLDCISLSDGFVEAPAILLAAGVPADEVQTFLLDHGLDPVRHHNPVSCLAVTLPDGRPVVIDSGMGAAPGPDGAPITTAGRFPQALRAAGIDPAAVEVALVSHLHPDHVGGYFGDDGEPVFPNARYYVSREEADFWQDPDNRLDGTLMPPPKKVQVLDTARRFLAQVGDRVVLFDAGGPAIDGVDTILLPGHTGGQVGFLFDGGAARLLYTADAVGHAAISLQRPEWRFGFDADSPLAVATRRSLTERLLEPGLYNFTPHFPWPSYGHVVRRDGKPVWIRGG